MKKDKMILKSATVLSGAIFATSLSAFAAGDADKVLNEYASLGSGAEVRNEIMNLNAPEILHNEANYKFGELKCGEGKCGEGKEKEKTEKNKKEVKKSEAKKSKEGEEKETGKKSGEAEKKEAEEKTSEAKCGEGKCG